jgi:hypothetical protein
MESKHLKTQPKYAKSWMDFLKFHDNPDVAVLDEEIFLQYFNFLIRDKSYCC